MEEVPLERPRIGDGRDWKQQSRVTTGFRPSATFQNKRGIVNYQVTCQGSFGCWASVWNLWIVAWVDYSGRSNR